MRYILLVFLLSCVNLQHVEPRIRFPEDRLAAAVLVETHCGDDTMFQRDAQAEGVIISERHVLTAAHAVRCPMIPRVYVILGNGDRHRVYVTREDDKNDIAKLELAHAGRFGLNIPPPKLQPNWMEGFWVCVEGIRTTNCLPWTGPSTIAGRLPHGSSGRGVYQLGSLVGLVSKDLPGENATAIGLINNSWLEGT